MLKTYLFLIFQVIILVFWVYMIYGHIKTGKTITKTVSIYREKEPFHYWFSICVEILVAVCFGYATYFTLANIFYGLKIY